MRVAVTGASGFIGRHVLAALAQRGIRPVVVTRNPEAFVDSAGIERVVAMDIATAGSDVYARLGQPEVLIHLAWDGLPHYQSPHHFETELPRQYAFLRAMVRGGLPALLVTGTCFEYGMQSGPLDEALATRPANAYGFAKDTLRRQLEFLHQTHPFQLGWARLFYTFGSGQPASSLLPQLQAAVRQGKPSFPMSGGAQLRDYLPVEDTARTIVQLALLRHEVGVVNICSGKPVSVRGLVEGWLRENRWDIRLDLGAYPYPDHEPMAFWGNRARLDALLNSP